MAVIGVALIAILALIFIIILITEPQDASSDTVQFASGEPTDILSVTVSNSYGVFRFYFDDTEGGYAIDDIPPFIVDLDVFINFLTNSASLFAIDHILHNDTDLQLYGLDQPSAEIEIVFFDGKALNLNLGTAEQISGYYYGTVSGYDGVFLFSPAMVGQFLLPKTQVISRFVTPPLAVSSPLSAIRDVTFTGGELAFPVTILTTSGKSGDVALEALSFGGATHIVRGAATWQLDQTYGVQILGSLFGIEAVGIAGYDLSNAELVMYGFDSPYMSVDYDMVNGVGADVSHMKLSVAPAEAGLYYATIEGSGVVYVIDREPFLDIRYELLLVRWFLTPFLMDLSAVTVRAPETSYRFELDNSDPLNPVVTHDGQSIDVTLFRAFFRLITGAAHDGNHLGKLPPPKPGEQEQLAIIYEYSKVGKSQDILTLYPGDVRRHNVYVNGAGEFSIKDLFAQRVIEGCKNLIAGNTIEENW